MKKALFVLILLFSSLEAGWSAKDSIHTFEETEWRDVCYNGTKVSFDAVLPNYDTVLHANDISSYVMDVKVDSKVGLIGDIAYVIQILPKSTPIKSGKEFKQLVERSYWGVNSSWLDAKKIGAKYAVEFTYLAAKGDVAYWRVVYKNNRLFSLGTTDENEGRRNHFFESFQVK